MPKLEAGGDYDFKVDGLPYNRGLYEAQWKTDNPDFMAIVHSQTRESLTDFHVYSEYTDLNDAAYTSRAALITALESFFF